jgi:hypothetical protein
MHTSMHGRGRHIGIRPRLRPRLGTPATSRHPPPRSGRSPRCHRRPGPSPAVSLGTTSRARPRRLPQGLGDPPPAAARHSHHPSPGRAADLALPWTTAVAVTLLTPSTRCSSTSTAQHSPHLAALLTAARISRADAWGCVVRTSSCVGGSRGQEFNFFPRSATIARRASIFLGDVSRWSSVVRCVDGFTLSAPRYDRDQLCRSPAAHHSPADLSRIRFRSWFALAFPAHVSRWHSPLAWAWA